MRTIAHLSDLHFGRHDQEVALRLLANICDDPPDLIVVTGDLTQRGRHWQFAAARDYFEKLPKPMIVIPGNHDVPLYDVAQRFIGGLARYRRYISREVQPFFADQEIAVLGLNTARSAAFSNGRISHAQANAIKAIFSEVPPERLKILAVHHPVSAPPGEADLAVVGRAPLALRAVLEAGVNLVLSGHHHQAYSGDLKVGELAAGNSVLIIHAGTAISTRLRGEPNSYNILRVEPTRVTCTVQVFQHKRFAPARTTEFALLGNRWVGQ
jgi:3',5'-cyclic AMP phosphodiesterase CpdA